MNKSDIKTPAKLLSISRETAKSAARRYVRYALKMHRYGNTLAATAFERISAWEYTREQLLIDWAKAEGLPLSASAKPLHWHHPYVRNDYDRAAGDPVRSTPYRVLAMLAHTQENAFHFFVSVAAYAEDDVLREYAEILADNELERLSQARASRRQAFHVERLQFPDRPALEPASVVTLADLLGIAGSMEQCICERVKGLLESNAALATVSASSTAILDAIRASNHHSGDISVAIAAEIEAVGHYCRASCHAHASLNSGLTQLQNDCDCCFMYYDAIVGRTADEVVMLRAQEFAVAAMDRIDSLREVMTKVASPR